MYKHLLCISNIENKKEIIQSECMCYFVCLSVVFFGGGGGWGWEGGLMILKYGRCDTAPYMCDRLTNCAHPCSDP